MEQKIVKAGGVTKAEYDSLQQELKNAEQNLLPYKEENVRLKDRIKELEEVNE